ncbi:MAG: saccharopine dehydrogenase NADP-binding domain-containing protein [Parvibaculaceae bacterium]|nr:saccharopine dehydrogenase NADP-binding domain-containing protein [Parvibaculaceae bacterium]
MSGEKKFDIVVYGATGFTGRLVAEYLNNQYGVGKTVNWAMAGRSQDKLVSVRDEMGLPAETPLVVANSDDAASIDAMVASTKVVLTTVGPYQLYGEGLVAACAQAGTDYVDLCGEPAWMSKMIDAYDAKAKASGARIVFSCGFDSIPFDLGVYFLQQKAKADLGSTVARVKGRVRGMQGTFSGGTKASLMATLEAAGKDPSIIKLLMDPFALTPGFTGPAQPAGNVPEEDPAVGGWVAPFIMAAINTRNVHRSNFLLGHPYGEDFVYDEMMMTGPGEQGKAAAEFVANDKSFESEDGPKPGEGPSKEEREAGFYDVLFIGEAKDGKSVRVSVKGDKDPGYGSTSKMISESAICLVQDDLDTKGGIWTAAPAMGDKLIARLEASAGLTFTQEDA